MCSAPRALRRRRPSPARRLPFPLPRRRRPRASRARPDEAASPLRAAAHRFGSPGRLWRGRGAPRGPSADARSAPGRRSSRPWRFRGTGRERRQAEGPGGGSATPPHRLRLQGASRSIRARLTRRREQGHHSHGGQARRHRAGSPGAHGSRRGPRWHRLHPQARRCPRQWPSDRHHSCVRDLRGLGPARPGSDHGDPTLAAGLMMGTARRKRGDCRMKAQTPTLGSLRWLGRSLRWLGGLLVLGLLGAGIGTAQTPDAPVQLKSISVERQGDGVTVLVSMSGPAKYAASFIDSPNRLVVDMQGTTFAWNRTAMKSDGDPVREVRGSQFRVGTARVVVELSRKVGYRIDERPEGLALVFEPGGTAQADKPAPKAKEMAKASTTSSAPSTITPPKVDAQRVAEALESLKLDFRPAP